MEGFLNVLTKQPGVIIPRVFSVRGCVVCVFSFLQASSFLSDSGVRIKMVMARLNLPACFCSRLSLVGLSLPYMPSP